MLRSLFRSCVALLLSFTAFGLASPAAPNATAAQPGMHEPVVQRGSLPNGFRYLILTLPQEPGRISLRLVVHAGSLDEHDDERGYAHFVEHMAFEGTTHYPPGKLVQFFQRLGLAWGADANAETSPTSTVYKLDLPSGHAAHFGDALEVLGDFAGGIAFAPREVKSERAVIASERTARDTAEWQAQSKLIAALYAGTGIPERLPIGEIAAINRAEPTALRRFYDRCYRPDRMTLVIVGDIEEPAALPLITARFGSLADRGQAAAAVHPAVAPQTGGPHPHIITSTVSDAAKVSLISVMPVGPDRPETIKSFFGTGVVMATLNRRISARQARVPGEIGHAESYMISGIDGLYSHQGLEAHAASTNWMAALRLTETELRRARIDGFTAAELHETTLAMLAAFRGSANRFDGQRADEIANGIASVQASGREWRSPVALRILAEDYLTTFTPAMASERLHAALSDDQLHIVVQLPTAPEGGTAAVLAAYVKSAAEDLPAPEAFAAELQFGYNDFGPAGVVAERRTRADLGVDLVRFVNGVKINLRPNDTEPHRFRISARMGRGTADIPRDQPGLHHLAMALMIWSDLGRHTREEFRRLADLSSVEGSWTFEDNDFIIELSGPTEALPFALRSVAARLSDLKLQPEKLAEAQTHYPELMGSLTNSASGFARSETLFRASGEDPRWRIPSQGEFKAHSFETVTAWMRQHWLDGPLEIGIAGDFQVDDVISTAAATVGALTPRQELPTTPADRVEFLKKPYRNLNYIPFADKAAVVRIFWPLHDGENLPTYRAIQVANAALLAHLQLKLRQEMGATYSPSVLIYRALAQPDFALVGIQATFEPNKAIRFAERTIKMAQDFGKKGLTKDEFARAREPLRAGALADIRSNEWWLANVLQRAQTQPEVLEEAATHGTAFDSLTCEAVNRAAAAVYRKEANCVGCIPAAGPPANGR